MTGNGQSPVRKYMHFFAEDTGGKLKEHGGTVGKMMLTQEICGPMVCHEAKIFSDMRAQDWAKFMFASSPHRSSLIIDAPQGMSQFYSSHHFFASFVEFKADQAILLA